MKLNKKIYTELQKAIKSGTRDGSKKTYYYCNDDILSKNVSEFVHNLAIEVNENCHDLDLSYEIINDAFSTLWDIEYKDFTYDNVDGNYTEFASVYNQDRLDYLKIWNESDISAIMQEFSSDSISTAAAIWYDQQVTSVLSKLLDWKNNAI